jgi:hypothetical protein
VTIDKQFCPSENASRNYKEYKLKSCLTSDILKSTDYCYKHCKSQMGMQKAISNILWIFHHTKEFSFCSNLSSKELAVKILFPDIKSAWYSSFY